MNEFTREVRQTTKSYKEVTRIRASDAVAGQYAPYLGAASTKISRPQQIIQEPVQRFQPLLPSITMAEESFSEVDDATEQQDTSPISIAPVINDDKLLAQKFFEDTGNGELTPTEVDYIGAKKRDQICRFLITYVWAYQHIFEKPVPSSEHIVAATKRAGLFDTNFSKYFQPTVNQYMLIHEGTYKMKPAGNMEARRIFDEMQNSSTKGFIYWSGSTRASKRPNRVSKEEQSQVENWLSLEVNIGKIDVRTLKPTQQAMLAIWLLTKQLKVGSALKPRLAFEYLVKKFTTISGNAKAFTTALSRPTNLRFFGKNATGLYYLKNEAEQEVEGWVGGIRPETITEDDLEGADSQGGNESE